MFYAPSSAEWTEAGAHIDVETDFPEGESATIKVTLQSPRELTLALRRPPWVGEGFSVQVNGKSVPEEILSPYRDVPESGRAVEGQPRVDESGTYVELKRAWQTGDSVRINLPKTLHLDSTPDNPRVAAFCGDRWF